MKDLGVDVRRVHVVVNPASGKDEAILNVLNRVFRENKVAWDVSITAKYGDATEQAMAAAKSGVDVVAGYGGDGTQHEVAIGLLKSGTNVPMMVLPGGTGNGFSKEFGVAKTLEVAVRQLCQAKKVRFIDVAKVGEDYFVQRLFTGIEPDEQTSREDKDRYGNLAYVIRDMKRIRNVKDIEYEIEIDGEVYKGKAHKIYVVNSGTSGSGIALGDFKIDDGELDAFALTTDMKSWLGAADRMLKIESETAKMHYRSGKKIRIEPEESQPVWMDGEFYGRTPVTVEVVEGALRVVDVRA